MDYFNIKTPNVRAALYMLSIRAPQPPFPPVDLFIFPLSPQNIRKSFTAMTGIYDTAGDPFSGGVERTPDSYGLAPFMYEIEGTTGWDRHIIDGFLYTGLQAIQKVQRMLQRYAQLNQIQKLNNSPYSFTLEFADFFNGEFYQVEPVGPQEIYATDRAPLLQYYRFRWAGIQPIGSPIQAQLASDHVALLLSIPGPATVRTAFAVCDAVQLNYGVV